MPMSWSATAYRRIVRSVTPRSVAAARPSTTGRLCSSSRNASSREAGREMPRFKHGCGQKVSSIISTGPTMVSDAQGAAFMGNDGRHDFDFYFGAWRIANRKRVNMVVPGDDEWVEFEATSEARPIVGGLGNVDTYSAPDF